jgi:DNA repair exonuclease SbcCD ATPase subunit
MANLTPAELQEARQRKRQEEADARRKAEEAEQAEAIEIEAKLAPLRDRLERLRTTEGRKDQLKSVLHGYYEELEKLSKKAPADQVTELQLKRINELIRQCKEVLQGDPFVDSLELFVAAGERPEHRDALFVLRDLRQGIQRFEEEVQRLLRQISAASPRPLMQDVMDDLR